MKTDYKNTANPKNIWYEKTWVIILLCIFLFPIGAYLLWKYTSFNKLAKGFITIIFALYFIGFIGSFSDGTKNSETSTSISSETGFTASHEAAASDTTSIPPETAPTVEVTATTEPQTDKAPETETQSDIVTVPAIQTTESVTVPATEAPVNAQVKVWISNTGKKYHRSSSCSNMKNPSLISLDEALSLGRTPCKKCY